MRAGRESGPHGSSETQGVTPVTAPFQHVASGDESSVDSSLLTAHRPELVMCLCPPHGWVTRRPDGPFGDRPVSRPQRCSTSSWMPRPRAFSARTHTKCLLTLRLDTSCPRPDALVPHHTADPNATSLGGLPTARSSHPLPHSTLFQFSAEPSSCHVSVLGVTFPVTGLRHPPQEKLLIGLHPIPTINNPWHMADVQHILTQPITPEYYCAHFAG